jgi:hypothetical protein
MLRRAPTTITLTSQDVQQYEENRERKILEARQKQAAAEAFNNSKGTKGKGSNDGSKLAPKEKSKKERIMGSGR